MRDQPKRIQRSRAKGWRMPEGAVVVDRSTPWGNPFIVGKDGNAEECTRLYRLLLSGFLCISCRANPKEQQRLARYAREHIADVRGKDLVCWCRLGRPCHADVLLEIANA